MLGENQELGRGDQEEREDLDNLLGTCCISGVGAELREVLIQ